MVTVEAVAWVVEITVEAVADGVGMESVAGSSRAPSRKTSTDHCHTCRTSTIPGMSVAEAARLFFREVATPQLEVVAAQVGMDP